MKMNKIMTTKNNQKSLSSPFSLSSTPSKQNGTVLLGTVLVLMVVVGVLSLTSAKTTILETKMVFNMQDKQRSLMAADSAAQYAWEQIKNNIDIKDVINNDTHSGYYVLGDKIDITGTNSKSGDDWDSNENVMSWPWADATKRVAMPTQLGGTTNPMKLLSNPQYTIGMHNSVLRKGTANYHCIPMSVIGASQGGTTQTRTLIELKTIPKSTCYHEKIK